MVKAARKALSLTNVPTCIVLKRDLLFLYIDKVVKVENLTERKIGLCLKRFLSKVNPRNEIHYGMLPKHFRYFKEKQMEGYINRAFKTVNGDKVTYEIRNAGVNVGSVGSEEFEGATFNVTTGDYSALMKLVCDNLENAKENAANDEERDMITGYIKSFTEVSVIFFPPK